MEGIWWKTLYPKREERLQSIPSGNYPIQSLSIQLEYKYIYIYNKRYLYLFLFLLYLRILTFSFFFLFRFDLFAECVYIGRTIRSTRTKLWKRNWSSPLGCCMELYPTSTRNPCVRNSFIHSFFHSFLVRSIPLKIHDNDSLFYYMYKYIYFYPSVVSSWVSCGYCTSFSSWFLILPSVLSSTACLSVCIFNNSIHPSLHPSTSNPPFQYTKRLFNIVCICM